MIILNTLKVALITISMLVLGSTPLRAQYILDEKLSFVYIEGTSTLHDWTASTISMSGHLKADIEGSKLTQLLTIKISIPANDIKSWKESMDKVMHKALKTNQHPIITYELYSCTIENGTLYTKGNLKVAGVTTCIDAKLVQKQVKTHIKLEGQVQLKMSDFSITPPDFLFGAFKTGDDITINFHFMFCLQEHKNYS